MATLAAYHEWYGRSGNIVLQYDITEVEIVSRYSLTGDEVASWDASADLDGSIMAHIVGTKLTIVWANMTEIPERMFNAFISLEKITGLGAVTAVGKLAFWRCYSVTSLDLVPQNLTRLGDDAFRMSSVEDVLDLSKLPANAVVGARATRAKRWGSELANVQAVAFPTNKIYFPVPNADSQQKGLYATIPFVTYTDGRLMHTLQDGCSRFALYHAWNCLYAGTDKVYSDMETWWNAILNADGKYAENNHSINGNYGRDCATLGWELIDSVPIETNEQLRYILGELSNGIPVKVTLKTASAHHSVLVVGCDPKTRKLAFVDSGVREECGVVIWCRYEDMCIGGYDGNFDDSERIDKIDFKVPMLAPQDTWYTQGGTSVKRATITEIEIVQSFEPTGSEKASWDASEKKNGSIMAYVDGTKLIIAGNGYRLIYANPDSSYAFANSNNSDYYTALTTIKGATLLNTSKVLNMGEMFRNSDVLASIDVSNWDVSSCKDISYLFHRCPSLTELDVSKWNTSNVESMQNTFNHCNQLKKIDVSHWDTSSCKDMVSMFQHCYVLTELNLSKWDTSLCENMTNMFFNTHNLQKATFGEKFGFVGDISKVLYAPSADYIPYADGNWYDHDYNAYAPTAIPSNVARTYYASKFIAADDDDEMVFVRNGTLRKMAVAIRHKNGKTDTMIPSAFADEVLAL